MSNYQRILSYIDAYEGETKLKNVGFAKVEIRAGRWRVEIKIRGTGASGALEVYALRENDIEKTRLGTVFLQAGEGEFLYQDEHRGEVGILLCGEDNVVYYTSWGETPVVPVAVLERKEEPLQVETLQPVRFQPSKPPKQPEAVDNPPEAAAEPSKPKSRHPRIWRVMCKVLPKKMAAPGYEAWEILEIHLQDIGRLPRKNWIYGNNSFVVQGFFRYGHLILASREENGRPVYRLGVPGLRNETENLVAGLFGFREFMPGKQEEEPDFGYWCTEVSLRSD